MRTTIRKWFWAWEFDKEEQWLADMAARGKALLSVRYATYEFEDCEPGEYAVASGESAGKCAVVYEA